MICYRSAAKKKEKKSAPSAKTVWVDKLVKGLLGNSVVFYRCEVMWEEEGRGVNRLVMGKCVFGWHVCACRQVCTLTYARHDVCVARALWIPFFRKGGKRAPTHPYCPHTHTRTLACQPGCVTRLSPDTSQEGRSVDINFFPPHGQLIDTGSVGLVKLLFKDFIPHNHLHPLPFNPPPFTPSIITAC